MLYNNGVVDNNYVLLHDRIDISAVSKITEKEYCVGGSTALIVAIAEPFIKSAALRRTLQKTTGRKVMSYHSDAKKLKP
jgi:hypothetical protein